MRRASFSEQRRPPRTLSQGQAATAPFARTPPHHLAPPPCRIAFRQGVLCSRHALSFFFLRAPGRNILKDSAQFHIQKQAPKKVAWAVNALGSVDEKRRGCVTRCPLSVQMAVPAETFRTPCEDEFTGLLQRSRTSWRASTYAWAIWMQNVAAYPKKTSPTSYNSYSNCCNT